MSYAILVAEPGYDVKTASDEHLSLKNDFTLLKVKQSGSVTLTGYTVIEVAHNLGYVPQFLAFGKFPDDDPVYPGMVIWPHVGFAYDATGMFVSADSSKLYISADPSVETGYYLIFYEQI